MSLSVTNERLNSVKLFIYCTLVLQPVSILNAVAENMVEVKASSFYMGENDIQDDEEPIHLVRVSSFHVDRYEVTVGDWEEVRDWALLNDYEFSLEQYYPLRGSSYNSETSANSYPMNMINWFDALKWCNARSEYFGRKPVYYLNAAKSEVYISGEIEIDETFVEWDASGYRLPTEAEWEKAARGGRIGMKYPWGSAIDGSKANYKLSGDPFDDGTTPVGYYNGKQEIKYRLNSLGGERQTPENEFHFGLYDVVGNVSEWCWDWYDEDWYDDPRSLTEDTAGPNPKTVSTSTLKKVHRGGGFKNGPSSSQGEPLRLAFRHVQFPSVSMKSIGLRCVRSDEEDTLWSGAKPLGSESSHWFHLNWLGYFYSSYISSSKGAEFGWVYHNEFGWVYPMGKGSYDNWIFFPTNPTGTQGYWMWTTKYAYPYFYKYEEKKWHWYEYLKVSFNSISFERFLDKEKIEWDFPFNN